MDLYNVVVVVDLGIGRQLHPLDRLSRIKVSLHTAWRLRSRITGVSGSLAAGVGSGAATRCRGTKGTMAVWWMVTVVAGTLTVTGMVMRLFVGTVTVLLALSRHRRRKN